MYSEERHSVTLSFRELNLEAAAGTPRSCCQAAAAAAAAAAPPPPLPCAPCCLELNVVDKLSHALIFLPQLSIFLLATLVAAPRRGGMCGQATGAALWSCPGGISSSRRPHSRHLRSADHVSQMTSPKRLCDPLRPPPGTADCIRSRRVLLGRPQRAVIAATRGDRRRTVIDNKVT